MIDEQEVDLQHVSDSDNMKELSAAKQKKKTITIHVEDDLYEEIRQAALDDDRTMPVTVRRVLQNHFNK